MSNIRQDIINIIKTNKQRAISGDVLQGVLLEMFDRDVFLTQEEYNALVIEGSVDPDKIYHIYENE